MPTVERWMVLGAGSWLGYLLLAQEGAGDTGETRLLGTVHRQLPGGLPEKVILQPVKHRGDIARLAGEYRPTVLVNFLRGEDPEDLAMHEELATFAAGNRPAMCWLHQSWRWMAMRASR